LADTLERFIAAQAGVYAEVVRDLLSGSKRGHWMWFIFPQLRGLGRTSTAEFYGIASSLEARDYLAHPLLGGRLLECTALVNRIQNKPLDEIFPFPDNLKFRSSMTLFGCVAKGDKASAFNNALARFCGGVPDPETVRRLGDSTPAAT